MAQAQTGCLQERVEGLANLFRDALLHIPASSVSVEKLHASTQQNAAARKSGRAHNTIQENSYIMACALEHARLKEAAEEETLGAKKIRAGRLLSSRAVARTTPGRTMSRVKKDPTVTKQSTFMKHGSD